jgi:hypothetical protein
MKNNKKTICGINILTTSVLIQVSIIVEGAYDVT